MNISFLADSGIDPQPVIDFVLGQLTPIFGLIAFAVVVGIVLYIGGFWLGYAIADEDKKEEMMASWKKNAKGLLIAGIICTSLGAILMTVGLMFGVSIDI